MPFDLVKKQPKGQQTFALMTKDIVTGSLITDVRPSSQLTLGYNHTFAFNINRFNSFLVSEDFMYTQCEY